jgi:hypothetical protein
VERPRTILLNLNVGAPVRCRSTPPSSRKRKLAEGFSIAAQEGVTKARSATKFRRKITE